MKLNRFALFALVLLAAPAFAADAPPNVAATAAGTGKVVALDQFYNHQLKAGKPFHYIWDDTAASGFSKFGKVLQEHGASITKLDSAPTAEDLKKVSIYIIVNPSLPKNAAGGKPNYISEPAISTIEQWVKDGGVLLLLANDPGKCEFTHFNELASRFGITFDANMRNTAPTSADRPHATFLKDRDNFPNHPLFAGLDATYMKEITSITVKEPAKPVFVVNKDPKESVKTNGGAGDNKDVIIAEAQVGKGFVVAVGDPWVYNEYFNAPKDWDKSVPWNNEKAAENLAGYLIEKARPPQTK